MMYKVKHTKYGGIPVRHKTAFYRGTVRIHLLCLPISTQRDELSPVYRYSGGLCSRHVLWVLDFSILAFEIA